MENHPFFQDNDNFVAFGAQHFSLLLTIALLSIAIPWLSTRYLNYFQRIWMARCIAVLISLWVVFWIATHYWLGDFEVEKHLPLDICNIVALLLPFLMWMPKYKVHEIIYFWILAGTMQALLTPNLDNSFPNYVWYKYWAVHGGLVVYAVYITVVFKLYPTWKSLWKSFLACNLYLLLVYFVNYLLGANYAYLMRKPSSASALDYMGDYPWYILTGQMVALLFFVIVLLPVKFFVRSSK